MRHYHGTPIGGTRVGEVQFARRRFLFVPWKRPESLVTAQAVSCGFACDNSAFSFWTTGERPEWKDYSKWIAEVSQHPKFDFCIVPDVIDGTEDDNRMLLARWWRSLPYRVATLGVPVWHLHESWEWLEHLIRHHAMIALGSSGEYSTPGAGKWWDRMDEAWDVITRDGMPRVRVHGLRMLRPDIIEAYPFYSCDSTNIVQNASRAAGKLELNPVAAMELEAARIEQYQSPERWERKAKEMLLF